ncbi:ion transporter [Amycolatopsis azurea]|uniref:Ion transporter n=1 Tax=Amycolatopsis azurea DSM 43854 TaxID=1238180 RepID=M2QHN5_9PSEU|nr:ion transporter [Amycolatopsis azurea]EMD25427.1 voltage-gated sodium channel [Amycolatopsis azurea DSM 43854]OOC08586.1 ion transporter [Amycolatopsis azurea DSM 43854]
MTGRETVARVVEDRRFQNFIIAVIVFNAITLGLETSTRMLAEYGRLLHTVDYIALTIFVLELCAKLYAYRTKFFRDPWNIFDLLVIGIAVIPTTGPFAVLRALRVLRVLRLISVVPSMRKVVSGLLTAIPGMASIAALLALIIFVAGVMATKLFGVISPDNFGDLGTSLFTLFQVMTGEAWPDIAKEIMKEAPLAWVFFVVYILVSSFAVLNLFIAVVVSGMEDELRQDIREEEAKQTEAQAQANTEILDELRALRAEVAELRQNA